MAAFEELAVMPELIRGIEEMEWLLPTDIQAEAIPLILGGGDVCAAAETGSGKTGAFALPIVQIVHEQLREQAKAKAPTGQVEPLFLNPDDREGDFAIDDTGLRAQTRQEFRWEGCRANLGFTKGKFYYEATVTDEGLCRVGWAAGGATYNLGTDRRTFGYGGTAKKAHGGDFHDYGEPYGINDVVGCAINFYDMTISFSKNGRDLGVAFTIPSHLKGFALYPAVTMKNAEILFNFGAKPFKHGPPDGYQPANAADVKQTSLFGAGNAATGRKPVCLILEPVRELAEQVHDQIESFKKYLPSPNPEAVLITGGGNDQDKQKRTLARGVDIVTGTVGRVLALVKDNTLDLSGIRFFVLDEADRLVQDVPMRDLMMLYRACPKASQRLQVLLFSATLHAPAISSLADTICRFPTWVDLKGRDTVPETVDHYVVPIDPTAGDKWWANEKVQIKTDGIHAKDKVTVGGKSKEAISEGIKLMKAQAALKFLEKNPVDQAIIFCRTKVDCDNLASFFDQHNKGSVGKHSCACLHSGLPLNARRQNLAEFTEGAFKYLICTDVAARGIDVRGLPCVLNMTLPDNPEDYIHRVGRTGRADVLGLAVSFVATHEEKVWFHKCNKPKTCANTSLLEMGGCAIWYSEPELRKGIEAKLDEALTVLPETFALPKRSIEDYGKVTVKKQQVPAAKAHTEELRPAVQELSGLEVNCQQSFLRWKLRKW